MPDEVRAAPKPGFDTPAGGNGEVRGGIGGGLASGGLMRGGGATAGTDDTRGAWP
jgi:hypothetical protein